MSSKETSLFETEEQTLARAEELLAGRTICPDTCAEHYRDLKNSYATLLRHARYLVRLSDRMQRDLNELNHLLVVSEEKYRSIFENVTEGIFRSHLDGTLLDVNPAMARILGYSSPRELLAEQSGSETLLFPDETEAGRFLGPIAKHGRVSNGQYRMVRKDGVQIWVEVSARTVESSKTRSTHIEGILSDVTERQRMLEDLRWLATTDGLTDLANRRHFLEMAGRELNRSVRYGRNLSLLMLDIDHFKAVNDTYGHDVGDMVLRMVARICREEVRECDLVGRLGGEEFAVLCPDTHEEEGAALAERLRTAIGQPRVPAPAGDLVNVTISIGCAGLTGDTPDLETLLKLSDRALYAAKDGGRDRVFKACDLEKESGIRPPFQA